MERTKVNVEEVEKVETVGTLPFGLDKKEDKESDE